MPPSEALVEEIARVICRHETEKFARYHGVPVATLPDPDATGKTKIYMECARAVLASEPVAKLVEGAHAFFANREGAYGTALIERGDLIEFARDIEAVRTALAPFLEEKETVDAAHPNR